MTTNHGQHIPTEPLPQNDEIDADNDSTYGSITDASDTTSLNSSVVRGYVEHGRRYQTVREGKGQYFVPADEKQFESYSAGHLTHLILESQQTNPLFRAPIKESELQNVLDLGTGDGAWAVDVADRFPQATVRGIDLSPPRNDWVPPNCILEVDDMCKPFTFKTSFDLIHIRLLLGAISYAEWDALYRRCYDALAPGGWIEQVEYNIDYQSDDGSLPKDAKIANIVKMFQPMALESGNPLDIEATMKESITRAGFVNMQEKVLKVPLGPWPKHPVYKDAGACNRMHFLAGTEGWSTWLLTKFGKPQPWSLEEVKVHVDAMKAEATNPQYHCYQFCRRVWAQKPHDAAPAKKQEPVVEQVPGSETA